MTTNYDMIDRFLRNNLDDDDYAEYSAALEAAMKVTDMNAQAGGFTASTLDNVEAERDRLKLLVQQAAETLTTNRGFHKIRRALLKEIGQ